MLECGLAQACTLNQVDDAHWHDGACQGRNKASNREFQHALGDVEQWTGEARPSKASYVGSLISDRITNSARRLCLLGRVRISSDLRGQYLS